MPMSEAELLAAVKHRCGQLGLLYHHCRESRSCSGQRGLPDLIIAGPGGVIFAELKSDSGETSPEQDLWLWTINESKSAEVIARLWRPGDWADGTIDFALHWIGVNRE